MTLSLRIVSDIHYTGAVERAAHAGQPVAMGGLSGYLAWLFHHFVWRRDPFAHNHCLDDFLADIQASDLVVGNGDFGADTAHVGVSDAACLASVQECLGKFSGLGERFRAVLGDHELGKSTLVGSLGGMRLQSWERCRQLGLLPFWQWELGQYLLIALTSSLVALPLYQSDTLPEEWPHWQELRTVHMEQIRAAFAALKPSQRVLLFCHDPSALPFLWQEQTVRARLAQVERTIIGHLHSPLFLWQSRLLAGMPPLHFLGKSIRRMSCALHQARHWRPFKVLLCPALAGIELTRKAGHLSLVLDPEGRHPVRFQSHYRPWR